MSTRIMALCWPLKMSPAQKAVVVSLADQANDDGVCWPGIGSISTRTCLSPRAVQDALTWLEATGAVERDFRYNKSTYYTVTPEKFDPTKAPPARVRRASTSDAPGAPGEFGASGEFRAPGGADGAPGGADGAPPEVQMAHPESSMNRNLSVIEPTVASRQAGRQSADETELQAASRRTWNAYASSHIARYGHEPKRNQMINSKVKQFVQRLGFEDAPHVAAFYVQCVNEAFVLRATHDFGILLSRAESYYTQWRTGQAMTATMAMQADRTQTNASAFQSMIEEATKREVRP